MAESEQVIGATSEFRSESDTLGRFIADKCVTGPRMTVRFSNSSLPGASGALIRAEAKLIDCRG